MIKKSIVYFGQRATHACDGKCAKAWGLNSRPTIQLSADPDDFAYLADDELGEAPQDPGTYEGGDAKPIGAAGPDDVNKWCVRECERAWLSPPGRPEAAPDLRDFSTRFYNKAPHGRPPAPATELTELPELIDQVADSLSDRQARAVTSNLDATQESALAEALRKHGEPR